MTAAVCPYCRAPIDPTDPLVVCAGCDTPHHEDCYQENGGCTVFGCKCGPADEPKLRLSTPDVVNATVAVNMAPAPISPTPSLPSSSDPVPSFAVEEYKQKVTFIVLGVLLGALGAHNFYAGYKKKALMQLALTVLTLGYGSPMSWIWAVIDVCTVERDSRGLQFKS